MNAFQAGQLVAFLRNFEEMPAHITEICDALEAEFSVPPEKKKRGGNKHEWTPEQRAAAAERLRTRQAAKKAQREEDAEDAD